MLNNRSTISTTYSINSASSKQNTWSVQQEASAKVYLQEFQTYLSSILAKGKRTDKGIKLICFRGL